MILMPVNIKIIRLAFCSPAATVCTLNKLGLFPENGEALYSDYTKILF